MITMTMDFEWKPVLENESAHYLFPNEITAYMRRQYGIPAIYRWVVESDKTIESIYIGETEELCPRRVYLTVQSLYDKGLVDVMETCPKISIARNLEPYVVKEVKRKEKEAAEMVISASLIKGTVYRLRPITEKFEGKYRVFEPKYLRRRR